MVEHGIPTDRLEGAERRVLVVEHEPPAAAPIVSALEGDGRFAVEVAPTGYDAGLVPVRFRPHLLLLRHPLPDLEGGVVARRVKASADLPGIRIIVMAPALEAPLIEALHADGVDGFLRRPFSAGDLLERVASVLEL